jgi:hypothetical protein
VEVGISPEAFRIPDVLHEWIGNEIDKEEEAQYASIRGNCEK